jgi:hypothetical protein
MTIRVGRISRNEDVHGISGTGEPAEVVEFSDGSIAVRWLGKDASTNVTNNIKNVVNVHGHGGKSEVEWLWEEPAPPDPMEAVFEKKILEAGGSVGADGPTAPTGPAEEAEEAAKDAEAEAIAEEIVEEAQEMTEKVAVKVAEKLAEKTAEKVAVKVAETAEKVEDAPE